MFVAPEIAVVVSHFRTAPAGPINAWRLR